MEIQITQQENATLIVTLQGRFDAFSANSVKASWQDNENVRSVILDLSQTTFLDSMALAALVQGLKEIRSRGGNFILANPSAMARTMFELTAMDRAFTIVPSVDDALGLMTVL